MIEEYKKGCEFILKEFDLPESTNIYDIISTIVKKYKELKEEKECGLFTAKDKSTEVETPTKGKKRGRPKKRN